MAEGTNLDLILSTDYLSIDDEKILQEENEANKITLGEDISLAIQIDPIDVRVEDPVEENKIKQIFYEIELDERT